MNDRPELTGFVAFFPPIAYNTTTSPNNGFLVSDVVSKPAVPYGQKIPSYARLEPLAKDVESASLGIAVLLAKNTSIGSWYYKMNNASSWLKMVVDNTMTNGKPSGNTSVFLLSGDARLVAVFFNKRLVFFKED